MEREEPSHSQLVKSRWNDFRSRCYTSYPEVHPGETFDFELRKTFKAEEKERERRFKNNEMTKKEVLHYLRGERERWHHQRTQHEFDCYSFCWNSKPTQDVCQDGKERFWREKMVKCPKACQSQIMRLFNKSVPLYVLTSSRLGELEHSKSKVHVCLQKALFCYLYSKWFRPYTTDIDSCQFIAKIFVPMDLECRDTKPTTALIDDIAEIHKEILGYIETVKENSLKTEERETAERKSQIPQTDVARHELEDLRLAARSGFKLHHMYVPALFKSLGIILCTEAWGRTGPFEIGNTSVCMFLTGIGDSGLSTPITFDSIEDKIQIFLQRGLRMAVQTTLDTAVDFVMDLEHREASAAARLPSDSVRRGFYPRPPVPEAYQHFFEDVHGWGPSSKWIDANAYQKWTGPGAVVDLDSFNMEERERMIWFKPRVQVNSRTFR